MEPDGEVLERDRIGMDSKMAWIDYIDFSHLNQRPVHIDY